MTYEEAKAIFEEDLKDGKCSDDCPECNARELAISAIEKQIPKKPRKTRCSLMCANCGHKITEIGCKKLIRLYCKKCGQAIDWSDDNAVN